MNSFSALNRSELLKRLHATKFDVLVIGGGITGSGIALDAASRGLKVALVDMQDLAGGTSSRSTRLIHGGLRYLKQLEFKLVAEVGRERKVIHRNAPHLVTPEPILLPITKTGSFGKTTTRLAMLVYEILAGVKKEERHQYLTAAETAQIEPSLKSDELLGGILYYEYRTNDARLTLAVMKEAVNRGTLALTYLKVNGFNYDSGKIISVNAEDRINGGLYKIHADFVINGAGPWVDELDRLDNKNQGNKLQLTKGVHLVLPQNKLPLKQAVYFDTADKRMVFALPHLDKTYIGTTDTFYEGDKTDPLVTKEDKLYLLTCVNDYFSGIALEISDIESCWAGIRPLIRKPGKNPSEISRKDEVFEWESGLFSIAGGKLSGYRKMAKRVVDLVAKKMTAGTKKQLSPCVTDEIFVSGGKTGTVDFVEFIKSKLLPGFELGLIQAEIEHIVRCYGTEADVLFRILKKLKENKNDIWALPPVLHAELIYAVENEMCLSPADFFIRRTPMLYFDVATVRKYKTVVTLRMQELLKWDDALKLKHEAEFDRLIEQANSTTK